MFDWQHPGRPHLLHLKAPVASKFASPTFICEGFKARYLTFWCNEHGIRLLAVGGSFPSETGLSD